MSAGGIYFIVACDWCSVEVLGGNTHSSRQDAIAERTRVVRYEGWLLKRPGRTDTVLLCPECAAEGR